MKKETVIEVVFYLLARYYSDIVVYLLYGSTSKDPYLRLKLRLFVCELFTLSRTLVLPYMKKNHHYP